ncbi:MAG: phosphomannomutase/phosphoglucomutase [Pseudomonadota bacterium]
MKALSPSVFRAYDIRGIVDKDFDEEWVERLGKACGTYFVHKGLSSAVIGYDCRHSSPAYHEALVRGLLSTGVDVVSIGTVPTPMLYFAVKHLQKQAGVMITASHNPPEYNGFKVVCGEATLYADEIQALWKLFEAGDFAEGNGIACAHDILPAYQEAIASRVKLHRPLKVIVDGGNGSGGEICAEILRRMGAEVIEQFCEPDGNFPNHHPDPVVVANMTALIDRVQSEGADLGIGLDGDADRLGAVDRNGRLLTGDELLALYAREMLARRPDSIVIGDVKCSYRLFDDIAAHGGQPMMWITGHSLIKARMIEVGAQLAGELSGHMFFEDNWFGFDDAIYGAARLLDLLSAGTEPLTALPGWVQTYSTREVHMPCPDSAKATIIAKAQAWFRERATINDIDGARVIFHDGWGLVRASNTQPVLVLRFEATTPERLLEIRQFMEAPIAAWIEEFTE